MKGFLKSTRVNKVKELHRDIIKNLFELALKVSIVEKFQDSTNKELT
jgi:hypothetical protein